MISNTTETFNGLLTDRIPVRRSSRNSPWYHHTSSTAICIPYYEHIAIPSNCTPSPLLNAHDIRTVTVVMYFCTEYSHHWCSGVLHSLGSAQYGVIWYETSLALNTFKLKLGTVLISSGSEKQAASVTVFDHFTTIKYKYSYLLTYLLN